MVRALKGGYSLAKYSLSSRAMLGLAFAVLNVCASRHFLLSNFGMLEKIFNFNHSHGLHYQPVYLSALPQAVARV